MWQRIMIVEDSPDYRLILTEKVKQYWPDAEIKAYENGKDAWESYDRGEFDPELVITDFQMPLATGDDLVRSFRARGCQYKTIVLHSGDSKLSEHRELYDRIFDKPSVGIMLDELSQRL